MKFSADDIKRIRESYSFVIPHRRVDAFSDDFPSPIVRTPQSADEMLVSIITTVPSMSDLDILRLVMSLGNVINHCGAEFLQRYPDAVCPPAKQAFDA